MAVAPLALGLLLAASSPSSPRSDGPPLVPRLRLDGPLLAEAGGPADRASDPHQAQLQSTHRLLRTATGVSLIVTALLGDVVALNRPTLLTDGRCQTGHPVFGSYGCGSLSTLHGMSAFLSVTLYTATGVLGLAMPDGVAFGRRDADWYRAAGWVHFVGILIQPVLGIITRFPDVIGVPSSSQAQFGKTMRTIHIGLGEVIAAAYLVTWLAAED